ncbi:prolyl oligopeptidase family serine peptidase [Undibacterium sp. Rencai35W]|uniref:prolyl oligopeptidase family serine peptidase n=1 Tax=Undibacterium sp. Rencai35W TaxID=3413046 RepID=UPI003BF42EE3
MFKAISRRQFIAFTAAGSAMPAWASSAKVLAPESATLSKLPPKTRVDPVTDRYWGVDVTDPYRWMEVQPKTAEWETWLRQQGEYARSTLDGLPKRAAILKRLEFYGSETDALQYVAPAGGRLFIYKRLGGEQGFKVFVRDKADGVERVLIDPLAGRKADEPPATLDYVLPCHTGSHIAYGISIGGSEVTTSYIKNVVSGDVVEITRILSRGSGWSADGTRFFYYRVRADAILGSQDFGRGASCWMHRLGTPPATDVEVFREAEGPDYEPMEDDTPQVKGAMNSNWVLGLHLLNGNDIAMVYITKAEDLFSGKPQWRKIAGRAAGVMSAKLVGDTVYILAKGRQSNGELVKVDASAGDFANGAVVLPVGEGVIDTMEVARDGVYVHDLTKGLGGLRRVSFEGKIERVQLQKSGAVWNIFATQDEDGPWFQMDDLTWPGVTYKVNATDLSTKQFVFAKPPSFDVATFKTTRIDAPTRDGVRVPLEILHRKDIKLNRRNPLLIVAYGSYGAILDPGFSASNLAFLEAGGVIVYAHVRGGGELGEAWHVAGKKATKPNTWRDAIDSAEHLIKLGWTAKKHLALWGTSAGGIMVGRAITERPDLFAAAIGEVGLFNTLRFELTANGPGNDAEFGTVKKEDEFHALQKMDAYHSVKDGTRYPATLLITGANDLRVEPWQIGKFAARLQAASTNVPGALLRVDYETGHYATSRKNGMAKMADIFSFIFAHTT